MSASSSDSTSASRTGTGSLPSGGGASEVEGALLQIEVNGEPRSVPAPSSVAGLLDVLGLTGKRVAVALNRSVIVRSRYAEVELSEGDRVEILEAVGGG